MSSHAKLSPIRYILGGLLNVLLLPILLPLGLLAMLVLAIVEDYSVWRATHGTR